MSLYYIAEQIKNKKDTKERAHKDDFSWKPVEGMCPTVPEFKIPNNRSEKFTRKRMGQALSFIKHNSRLRFKDKVTIMPISCTSDYMIEIYGKHPSAVRGIQSLIDVGLISVAVNKYRFNSGKENECKKYYYFPENEKHIISYCKEHNIDSFYANISHNNNTSTPLTNLNTNVLLGGVGIESLYKIGIGNNINVRKPSSVPMDQWENYIESVVYNKYPVLLHNKIDVMIINDKYYKEYPELKLKSEINYKYDDEGTLLGISYRIPSSSCNLKKEPSHELDMSRKDLLSTLGMNLEFDIKSSVPVITKCLNSKKYIYDGRDFYMDIANEFNKIDGVEKLDRSPEETRETIKELFMRPYFDSDSQLVSHTMHKMAEIGDKKTVYTDMKAFKQAVDTTIGNSYGAEIFLHESSICLQVTKKLLEQGFLVLNVYDCWYAKKDGVTQEEFTDIVINLLRESGNEYIEKYYKYVNFIRKVA